MTPGRFIVLEGMDGSGKSSQATALADWLEQQGQQVVRCHDPGATPTGEAIREILLHRHDLYLTGESEMLLYMAARAQLVREVIEPALANQAWVVSDRFLMSNIVYQGHAGGLDPDVVRQVGQVATGGREPDLTLVLDIDLATAATRLDRPLDKLEQRGDAYRERLRQGYQFEAERAQAVVIDASAEKQTVTASLLAAVSETFPELHGPVGG